MRTSDRDKALYSLLHSAREDLNQARFFAKHLLKKGWHFEPWERRTSIYLQQAAFTTALAVSYARPFTQVRGQPAFPIRLISGYDMAERKIHVQVMELRNKLYAHSDVNVRKAEPLEIDGQHGVVEFLPAMKFSKAEAESIVHMVDTASHAVQARLEQLFASIKREA